MPGFARLPVFGFARRLVPGFGKMLVAAPAAAPARECEALSGLGQVRELLPGLVIEDHCPHGNLEDEVRAGMAGAVRPFAMAAALGAEFAVEAIAQKRIVMRVRFQEDGAARAAVAARRASARHELLPAESHAAVAAVTRFHVNFGFVNKHRKSLPSQR